MTARLYEITTFFGTVRVLIQPNRQAFIVWDEYNTQRFSRSYIADLLRQNRFDTERV